MSLLHNSTNGTPNWIKSLYVSYDTKVENNKWNKVIKNNSWKIDNKELHYKTQRYTRYRKTSFQQNIQYEIDGEGHPFICRLYINTPRNMVPKGN